MPKQLSKCREWEKERRNRLNNSFANLNKLLPNYDPSINRSKSDILHRAAEYVQELQDKVKDILAKDDKCKPFQEEIRKLCQRIKKLLTRNEQLSKLLQDAGIRVPSECGSVKKFKDRKKWANKITPEQAKIIVEKYESQKENKPKKLHIRSKIKSSGKSARKIKNIKASMITGNKLILQSNAFKAAESQQCFVINNIPSNTGTLTTTSVITSPSIFSAPLVTSAIKSSATANKITKSNPALNTLGPGTLILANGNIVPILPQAPILPPQAIIHSSPIIVNPTPTNNNTTLFIVSNPLSSSGTKSTTTTSSTTNAVNSKISTILSNKNYSNIKPKCNVTKTTQINKVPIPALSSQFSLASKMHLEKNISKKISDSCKPKPTDIADDEKKSAVKRIRVAKKQVVANKRLKIDNNVDAAPSQNDSSKKANKSYSIDSLCSESVAPTRNNKQHDSNSPQDEDESKSSNAGLRSDSVSEAVDVIVPDNKVEDVADGGNVEKSNKIDLAVQEVQESVENEGKESVSNANVSNERNSDVATSADMEKIKILSNQLINNSQAVGNVLAKDEETSKSSEVLHAEKAKDRNLKEQQPEKALPETKMPDKNLQIPDNVHSDLSNDLFAHLQVPAGSQNPESTSPTAAFLLAFPLVSSLTGVKVTEVMEDEATDSCHETPTLLQIGTMDNNKPIQTQSESLTPNLLNLDTFAFFSSKDMCVYQTFENNNQNPIPAAPVATTANNLPSLCETQKIAIPIDTSKAQINSSTSKLLPNYDNSGASISTTPKFDHAGTKPIYSTANINVIPVAKDVDKFADKTNQNNDSYIISSHMYNTLYSQSYSNAQQSANNAVPATTTMHNKQLAPAPKSKPLDSKTSSSSSSSCRQYSTSTSKNFGNDHYNTFNPFTDLSKSTSCCYDTTKTFNEPFFTSNANYNYNYQSEINFDVGYVGQAKAPKNERQNYASYDQSYLDYKNLEINNLNLNPSFYNNHHHHHSHNPADKGNKSNKHSKSSNNVKPPVNWMTTPDVKQPPDLLVAGKEIDFPANPVYSSAPFVANTQSTSTYFNANPTIYPGTELQNNFDNRKPLESTFVPTNPFSRTNEPASEDNHFSWSPTKLQLLEPPTGFVSSTLPTLVGDLALGNTSQINFNEPPKIDAKHGQRSAKDSLKRIKPQTYESQSNFLSVSQLVDHNKPGQTVHGPNRVASRRNSGNRSVKPNVTPKNSKRAPNKQPPDSKEATGLIPHSYPKQNQAKLPAYHAQESVTNNDWDADIKQLNRHNTKSTSYSAEALIGINSNVNDNLIGGKTRHNHQQQHQHQNNNFPISSKSFLADNILPYFPTPPAAGVDLPSAQDNNFMQQNSTYPAHHHNFSTCTTYSTSSLMQTTITSNYLPSSNFIPDITSHDYNPMISENVNIFSHSNAKSGDNKLYSNKNVPSKQLTHAGSNNSNNNRSEEKRNALLAPGNGNNSNNSNVNNCTFRKTKRKTSNETGNLPGFVDFSFLSMPSAINSPILPDDFHAHSNFLPPPTPTHQLYPCKNPLYTKQNDIPSSSLLPLPTVSRNNMQIDISPSMMNNVGSTLTNFNLSTIFPEINKSSTLHDFNPQKNYFPSTSQNHFGSKPSFASSYINTTQSFSS